jgi:hypothetical protein
MKVKTRYRAFRDGGAVTPEISTGPHTSVSIDTDLSPKAVADHFGDDDASAAIAKQIAALRQSETIQHQRKLAADFFAANPEMPKNVGVLAAAENEAIQQGHEPHSDAFYKEVKQRFEDKMIAMQQPHPLEPKPEPEPDVTITMSRDRAGLYSAPVSRNDPPSASGEKPSRITLTAEMKDMARRLGQSEAEYARGLIAMRERDKEYGR